MVKTNADPTWTALPQAEMMGNSSPPGWWPFGKRMQGHGIEIAFT
jgi:hypothetical protein